MHTELTVTHTPIIVCGKEYWKYALRNLGEEVGFSHFHPRLADVFLRERAERCRPGHFIITVRKHSMKLSQGSKKGCLHNIPLLLLSKLALFYILQLKALFSFKFQALSFGLCPIWTHRCLSFYCAFCSYIYLLTYCIWNQVPDVEILHRSNNTGSKYNQIPVFILSNEPLAVDLVLLSKVSQHAQHSS